MTLKEMLEENKKEEIWKKYCGFLELSMDEYMSVQKRLMEEQIELWSSSELGQSILKGKHPRTLEEFRKQVPLTTYDDYSDVLLKKQSRGLPGNPVIWIQTTWEGGKHPLKLAPYTRSMLDAFRDNVIACLILSTSLSKGNFDVENTDKILYGLAPLPYATGLFPLVLKEEIDIQFLPAVEDAVQMSFSQRNKVGFKLALKQDLEYFFGLGSVSYAVSQSLMEMSKSSSSMSLSSLLEYKPHMLLRILKAKKRAQKENRPILPKDLFHLKGFMVAGTDNNCYKDDLEKLWGVRPMELFAGTEPTIIGTETWTRDGMYFFPDTCFYEFIPEIEMIKNMEDPSYVPKTYLMNEVRPQENYEIVLTVLKGGAFARYRVGDMYRCVGLENKEDGTRIPRFHYIDRVPSIIDIAGFTRISEDGIQHVIELSKVSIKNWVAVKEFNEKKRPYLHLYIELEKESLIHSALSNEIIHSLLTAYFKYIDQDYRDLKNILGVDPLEISILHCGTFDTYYKKTNKKIRHMNPTYYELNELLNIQKDRNQRGDMN